MSNPNPLKPLVQRLTSTPVKDLPAVAYFLASSISICFLSSQTAQSDNATLLHKLKTRISSLLQDRLPEGRFTAVVIIKALIEVGGREILAESESWIRGLIGILSKSDPVSVKKLAIVTITRAFLLTEEYPSIVREVTTPLLPAFNTASLAAIRPKTVKSDQGTEVILSPLLPTVLQCWTELLPQHPSTFRPFVTRFKPICLSLLSHADTPADVCEDAAALIVALHHSAPKNGAASEWLELCQDVITSTHATANQLFRAVYEEWTPSEPSMPQASQKMNYREEPRIDGQDKLGLTGWVGIHQGARRLSTLLKLAEAAICSETAKDVLIPFGGLLDLASRLMFLVVPIGSRQQSYPYRPNPEIGKEERETLFSEMPTIHVHTIGLLVKMFEIFQYVLLPISQTVLDLLVWLFGAEQDFAHIRCATYSLFNAILPFSGVTATETDIEQISAIIRWCCKDLLPAAKIKSAVPNGQAKTNSKGAHTTNVDSFAEKSKLNARKTPSEATHALETVASGLLSAFLTHVPASVIPRSLRTEVDRTAILIQHQEAILASVLNPAGSQKGQRVPASILPFLAQGEGGLHTEAFLRPRMPVIEDGTSYEVEGMEVDVKSPGPTQDLDGVNLLKHGEDYVAPEKSVAPGTGTETSKWPSRIVSSFPNKREYSAIDGISINDVETENTPLHLLPEKETVKKPRLEEPLPAETKLSEDSMVNKLELTPEVGSTNDFAAGFAISGVLPEVIGGIIQGSSASLQQKEKPQGNTEEDSDSDIPEINADPDTDDEEEDSEEDENMEHE